MDNAREDDSRLCAVCHRRPVNVVPLYHARLQPLPILVQPHHRVVDAALPSHQRARVSKALLLMPQCRQLNIAPSVSCMCSTGKQHKQARQP